MAAGMHTPGVLRGMRESVVLGHRQGVDVGAQANGAGARAILDNADHAGATKASVDRNAPFGELGRDHVGGTLFLDTQFGMGMDVAPHRLYLGRLADEGIDDVHVALLVIRFTAVCLRQRHRFGNSMPRERSRRPALP